MTRPPRGIIVAVSPDGVIGLHGHIPWHYSGDLHRFKRLTLGGTVVMGRRTWESLPVQPLPGRLNLVVTSRELEGGLDGELAGVACHASLRAALAAAQGPVWFIGGAGIYREALDFADFIDMTLVPDRVTDPQAVRFPVLDERVWEAGPERPHEDDARLRRRVWRRR